MHYIVIFMYIYFNLCMFDPCGLYAHTLNQDRDVRYLLMQFAALSHSSDFSFKHCLDCRFYLKMLVRFLKFLEN